MFILNHNGINLEQISDIRTVKDAVDITSNIFVLSWLSSAKTVHKKREERTKYFLAQKSSFSREKFVSFHGE